MAKGKFFARLYLFDIDQYELEVWDHDLVPMENATRPISEWAREHLECSGYDFRELLGLPKEGDFQVVFSGEIVGWWSHSFEGDEWEEDLEIEKCEFKEMPAEFAKHFYEVENVG